jgi:hypothetical protein
MMNKDVKTGLIVGGIIAASGALVYFLFFKNKTAAQSTGAVNLPNNPPLDPYFNVDKSTKVDVIKNYLQENGAFWLFADAFAKSYDSSINAWYTAIQKNQPTFTYYDRILLTNRTINTKTGNKI